MSAVLYKRFAVVLAGLLMLLGLGAAPATAQATPGAAIPAECPSSLHCVVVPAPYANDNGNIEDYWNFDYADRPHDMAINSIVIHDTEGSLQATAGPLPVAFLRQRPLRHCRGRYRLPRRAARPASRCSAGRFRRSLCIRPACWRHRRLHFGFRRSARRRRCRTPSVQASGTRYWMQHWLMFHRPRRGSGRRRGHPS